MEMKVIEIKDLTFVYPDGRKALQNINMEVFKDDSLGIIGPNGAGKTTLLLHLNGILRGKGSIVVSGINMNNENMREIRRRIGLVFQDPDSQLFCPTVFEDVAFGPLNLKLSHQEVKRRVADALGKVGLSGFEERSSHHLSLGEKKRVAIATVLSMDPQILILDEPTSNLDPKGRRELIKLLQDLKITKVIAGHDLDLILTICPRVILLNRGKKVANGSASEILENQELLRQNGL